MAKSKFFFNEDDVSTRLLKKGLYDFDAEQRQVHVFRGTAEVYAGVKPIKLTSEHELTLSAADLLAADAHAKPLDEACEIDAGKSSLTGFSGHRPRHLRSAADSSAARKYY
jgi:hypothetical protein